MNHELFLMSFSKYSKEFHSVSQEGYVNSIKLGAKKSIHYFIANRNILKYGRMPNKV
jgi:hypothetical protein